jgi:polar amino acid transport system substrate-binding protein
MSTRLSRRHIWPAALFLVAALVLAACGTEGEDEPTTESGAAPGESCAKEDLPLLEPGQLTIATDSPAYPPWFQNNDPTNGKGYESAVAYAIAEEMGFSEDEVEWVVEPFNKSYAPGDKDFDFDINQISITPKREEAVDFSEGYYDVSQALIALEGSPAAETASLEELAQLKLGAQVGTTSYGYIVEQVQPEEDPFTYDNTNDAKSALRAGQIDGIVVDLPTAFYITAAEIPGSTVVGQFAQVGGEQEQFGLLFEQGNPLVECVNEAIGTLKEDGMLEDIERQWLSEKVDAPVFD